MKVTSPQAGPPRKSSGAALPRLVTTPYADDRKPEWLDNWKTPHWQLACGHWTHYEAQESARLWKPKRGLYYCEHWPKPCGWVEAMPKPKTPKISQEPLF